MKRSKTDNRLFVDITQPIEKEEKKWKKTDKWKDPWRSY